MGLEIRTVPKGWEHPVTHRAGRHKSDLAYQPKGGPYWSWQPIYDRDWLSTYREWLRNKIV